VYFFRFKENLRLEKYNSCRLIDSVQGGL